MKRHALIGVVIAVTGVALVVGGRVVMSADRDETPPESLARVVTRDIGSFVKATGIVRPMAGAEVRVGSRASGIVKRLFVRIGDTVIKGQPLAELETRELLARRDQAAAALASARANLSYSEAVCSRTRALAREQAVPRSDVELAERGFAIAEAAVAEAQASLELARTQLDYARLLAPIGGAIASITTQEGETVSASLTAPTFVTIVDVTRLEVWAYVDEMDIGRIEIGQDASFTVDAYPDHELKGRVAAIHPKAEIRDNVVDYVVIISLTGQEAEAHPVAARRTDRGPRQEAATDAAAEIRPPAETQAHPQTPTLRPEMTASVRITLAVREDVLAVPRRAVHRADGQTFVLTKAAGKTVKTLVSVGSRDDSYYEITAGLRQGDEVVVGDASLTAEAAGSVSGNAVGAP